MSSSPPSPPPSHGAASRPDGPFFPYAAGGPDSLRFQRVSGALAARYSFEREIGRGGAAYVFLAEDRITRDHVAVKVLRSDIAAALGQARFQREIDIARGLEHPNILPVLDSGAGEGQFYYTMPFVVGETLRDRLRRERQLELHDALAITRAVASALDHAHSRGVIHRDIKPANILLDQSRAVISDFGIARAMSLGTRSAGQITESGVTLGTPEYMSPEQGTATRELDARSDIYALGCVVYEMLIGEPPFTGPTAQAVIARHCHEPPRSLRVVRPAIPPAVEDAVIKALAKVPADRYSTAGEFSSALEQGLVTPQRHLTYASKLAMALPLAAALVAAAIWIVTRPAAPALDPNRIVVFPLHDAAAPEGSESAGEEVATFIGYALDETRPLKWLDGWEFLRGAQRSSRSGPRLAPNDAAALSRQAGAEFYIDGSIIRRSDSVIVLLSLHNVAGDSNAVVRRAQRAGPAATATIHHLGLRAVGELLPALVAPGGTIDLSALSQRSPLAVANFLQGEREYRRMQFQAALAHYEASLREDSAFALAALRGAQAANWESEFGTGVRLARVAVDRVQSLPPAQAALARGLNAYLSGSADSAISYLQRSLAIDSGLHAAWALLGEVASRMLPSEVTSDSLARGALARARSGDADFAPTLLLLEEMAIRDGDIPTALRLRDELRRAGADTTHSVSRELMLRCVRDGVTAIDWRREVTRDEQSVATAAKTLAGGAAQPGCAVAAFRALLDAGATPNARWAGLLGSQSLLVATNRLQDARDVFASKSAEGLPVHHIYLLLSAAGAPFDSQARLFADSVARQYAQPSSMVLWELGHFEARQGHASRVQEIAAILKRRADSTASRRDSLLARAIAARAHLLTADTTGTIARLRGLAPTAPRGEITWQPWESLGPERLLLAELLFARNEWDAARKVADLLDAPEPITYPLYLRQSLALRARAAEAARDSRAAATYRKRLQALDTAHDEGSTR
ncbi:MAG: serine/threonine-protein kinase [Gemmatimonadota bacterium]